jgi:hypothetical protein
VAKAAPTEFVTIYEIFGLETVAPKILHNRSIRDIPAVML